MAPRPDPSAARSSADRPATDRTPTARQHGPALTGRRRSPLDLSAAGGSRPPTARHSHTDRPPARPRHGDRVMHRRCSRERAAYYASAMTIKRSLDAFLAEERERDVTAVEATSRAIDDLVMFLEGYGDQYAAEDGGSHYGDDEDEDDELETSFIETHSPRILPASVDEFLFWWQIRDAYGGGDQARARAETIERLMGFLAERNAVKPAEAEASRALARRAAEEVPRAKALEELLRPLTAKPPPGESSDADEVVEDFRQISRVETGRLWLGADVGPLEVPPEATDVAQVGWWINLVVVQREGTWYLTELGSVYPKLDPEDDTTGWGGR